jgi:Protein of unknown function (DUF3071)
VRTLTVVGLAESGAHLLCEDPANGEQFALPGEQLRSAAGAYRERQRDQHQPAGPVRASEESTVQTPLTPREIQTRIRHGESLDEVAAAAGWDPAKIEKFAYPVLMERAVTADRARTATVVIGGLPGKESIERIAGRTLASRGQATGLTWDAHRDDDGGWVLLLRWSAGHTGNVARFSYHPGTSGGTVVPLDDAAHALVEVAPQPLRTVVDEPVQEPAAPRNPLLLTDSPVATPDPAAPQVHQPALPGTTGDDHQGPRSNNNNNNKVAAALAHHAVASPSNASAPTQVIPVALRGRADTGRSGKPTMPSWEDVLLGVRSSG